jgi:hypothetical protein
VMKMLAQRTLSRRLTLNKITSLEYFPSGLVEISCNLVSYLG